MKFFKMFLIVLILLGWFNNQNAESKAISPKGRLSKNELIICCSLEREGLGYAIHPGGLHSQKQIEVARKNIECGIQPWITAYKALIEEAKKNVEKLPEAVVDFNVPGYYEDAKEHRKMMGRLSRDAWAAYSCAIAYQLTTGKEGMQYASKAIQILMAWAVTNTKTSSYDGDLAMADAGVGLIFAAELMTGYKEWNKEQQSVFKNWVTSVYLNSCKKIAEESNNWGDWGNLGCIASHYFLDDKDAIYNDIERIKKRIDRAIDADGSMPHEIARGKRGMWYTYFSLAPLTASCQIALNACGIDLFNFKGKDGVGIEQALDYLLYYEQAPENWPHYEGKDLLKGKPELYPGNLFEAMYGIYGKEEYGTWVKGARPVMVYGHHYAWAVPSLLRTIPPCINEKCLN